MIQNLQIVETELTEAVLEELIRLSVDWEKENSCHGYRKNEKSDIEGNRIFLALLGDTVTGYLFGHAEKSVKATSIMPDGTPCFEVEEIYIRPEYRNMGIGRQLFSFVERTVSGEVDYLTLSTATRNWKAILHFYLDELGMNFWNARLFRKIAKEAEQMTESKKPLFREMRRFKQQISEAECLRILQEEKRGVLSMHGENGYPYGIPMNHWYNPADGKLYFHGAGTGQKIDALTACSKVSYCVFDAGYRREGEWALNVNSVVVFGRISLVTDTEKARMICENLCRKFTDDEEYIRKELESALPRVQCLELVIDHMTGKLVNES